jgi:hypothetical protein
MKLSGLLLKSNRNVTRAGFPVGSFPALQKCLNLFTRWGKCSSRNNPAEIFRFFQLWRVYMHVNTVHLWLNADRSFAGNKITIYIYYNVL